MIFKYGKRFRYAPSFNKVHKNGFKDDNHLCVKLTAFRGIQKEFFSVTTQPHELSIDNRPSRHVPTPEKAE